MKTYPPGYPCWAPGASSYLEEVISGEEVAVEWGGGASSIWLAPKVAYLHTIEHSADWAERIVAGLTGIANFMLHSHPYLSEDYVDCVDQFSYGGLPTLWLIDGYRRIDCLAKVMEKSTDGDLVVMDDALDYAEHLLSRHQRHIKRFAMKHPYAGTPIDVKRHKKQRNTVRTHHALTKETWVWRV